MSYIAVPMGDPAGIGPEIILKAFCRDGIGVLPAFVVGDEALLRKLCREMQLDIEIVRIDRPSQAAFSEGRVHVISLDNVDDTLRMGEVQAMAGKAAFEYIEKATALCLSGEASAMATTPINKESVRAAGLAFIGHTEMLASLSSVADPLTMFHTGSLRVFFLSRHVSLRRACDVVTRKRVANYIRRCLKALETLGISEPLLAVAGLNPHNGEHGLFGDEEGREIVPAVIRAREDGLRVTGPVPADSVFYQARTGRYDAVLSLYHDQGHIACKTLDFERTISLTIGLPFLRTSVDHGTAFDIAGKGVASAVSMVEAVRLAAQYMEGYHAPVENEEVGEEAE